MSKVGDYVSELLPPTSLYFIHQMLYKYGQPRWNDTDRVEPKNSEKNPSKSHMD
jgi:hypothetical protein